MYCSNCGKQLNTDQKFCAECGSKANATVSPPLHAASPPGHAPLALPYAGFWRRFLGWLIDYFISVITIAAIVILVSTQILGKSAAGSAITIIYFLFPLLYVVLMESSRLQATLGKLAVGIKVSDIAGNRISVARALGRFLAQI
jgi:uncharacterized RDD family membrane protein YckC